MTRDASRYTPTHVSGLFMFDSASRRISHEREPLQPVVAKAPNNPVRSAGTKSKIRGLASNIGEHELPCRCSDHVPLIVTLKG
jgi:hypothetical protein